MNDVFELNHGDCLEVLKAMPDCSVDSVVTDPPYGLSFMGRKWDYDVPSEEIWRECLRVLKPGGHLLAFAGTRTQHRMAVRIEDAGFEIRDMIAWVYGSGFPKSLDVSKAIDRRGGANTEHLEARIALAKEIRIKRESAGVSRSQLAAWFPQYAAVTANWERIDEGFRVPTEQAYATLVERLGIADKWRDMVRAEDLRRIVSEGGTDRRQDGTVYGLAHSGVKYESTTDAASQWQGWGTALKPALETVTFASKPYTAEQERDIIQSNLIRLEARLWLLSSASAAEKNSTSNPSEYGAACAIAQWSADEITNTRAALCGQMDTSRFESATNISLSIVSSWRRTLAASWNDGNTSTIETKSSTTIDWKTLKFSLSQITPSTIIKACSLPGGFSANASTAENHFNASLSLLQSILTLSATEPAISQAQHEHLGAGVKPNLDPCILARKPFEGTVAANVLKHGTGAINVDGCRVELNGDYKCRANGRPSQTGLPDNYDSLKANQPDHLGRWPANFIHDGSQEVVEMFPQSKSTGGQSSLGAFRNGDVYGKGKDERWIDDPGYGDFGSAARFFYCAKASKKDRNEGCEQLERKISARSCQAQAEAKRGNVVECEGGAFNKARLVQNNHPTVKPTDLMRYLCRLVTPPGGVILDPFMGSGSTGKAAILEGFKFIGIEREAEYLSIAMSRIGDAVKSCEDRLF